VEGDHVGTDRLPRSDQRLAFVLASRSLEVERRRRRPDAHAPLRSRASTHLIWLGTGALELGAISLLWYCFRERDAVLDLFELVTGVRMHTRYFQAGGLAEDIPPGFFTECRKFADIFPGRVDEYEALLDRQAIWLERTKGIGLLSAEDAIALGQSRPVLRASGVDGTCARRSPTSRRPDRLPCRSIPTGDVYDRYGAHGRDARVDAIVQQCLDGSGDNGPWTTAGRPASSHELRHVRGASSTAALVTEGYRARGRGMWLPSPHAASSGATSSPTADRSPGA
jgi:NADH-quinone oxidoreductase subunit D